MAERYFDVCISGYVDGDTRRVYRPASLNNPKDNAVMFVTGTFVDRADSLLQCRDCLIFWPIDVSPNAQIIQRHAVCQVKDPRNAYCEFFRNQGITNLPKTETVDFVNGAYIAKTATVGKNCRIFPNVYIGGDVQIGNNVYIGSGTRIIGKVSIGNNVVIRENAVIGADGLSTNRDKEGKALTMPQFGGVTIEDDVQIGALTVIGRGAIDNTVIKRGAKIDNSCFISHNVIVGEDAFIVGETIMFGSSSLGKQGYISGNATIREGRHVGDKAKVGMGAVVTKDVGANCVVKGNPAR